MGNPSNITLDVSQAFNTKNFDQFLSDNGATKEVTKNQHQRGLWRLGKITIVQYDSCIVVQGKINAHPSFIDALKKLDGLDARSAETEKASYPKQHNSIVCAKCKKSSFAIDAVEEGLQIKFTKQCGHQDDMSQPLLMINNRILPDVSILVSKSLSRVIELGAFAGYEILIPKFLMAMIDTLKDARGKSANDEVSVLKSLEQEKGIIVRSFPTEYQESDLKREDDKIIELADITNSILLTSDDNMKAKAVSNSRPVIFFDRKAHGDTKTAHRVRT